MVAVFSGAVAAGLLQRGLLQRVLELAPAAGGEGGELRGIWSANAGRKHAAAAAAFAALEAVLRILQQAAPPFARRPAKQ